MKSETKRKNNVYVSVCRCVLNIVGQTTYNDEWTTYMPRFPIYTRFRNK